MAPPVGDEPGHHPVGGRQPEGAAPGEQERLRLLHTHARLEQGVLPGGGGAAPHLAGDDVGLGEDHHGASGHGRRVLPVADPDTRYRGDGPIHEYLRGTRGPMEQTTS